MNRRVFEDKIKCPIDLSIIKEDQKTDSDLHRRLKDKKDKDRFGKKTFGDIALWTESMKDGVSLIYVPEKLVTDLVKWYHSTLIHPGTDRMHNTVRYHYYWKGMAKDIADYVKKCSKYQRFKITGKKNYGKIPLTTFDRSKSWDVVHMDMIGPWTVNFT